MRNSGYNTGEYKILDTYLSRINPRDPSTCTVTFTKDEYCELMGLAGQVRTNQLKNYTSHFLGNIVTLPRSDKKKGYVQAALFKSASYDEEEQLITLTCNDDPLIFNTFFNIDTIGYVRYRLSNIVNLNSAYAIKLYFYLRDNAFRKKFTIKFKELREKIECTSRYYESYTNFNKDILKRIIDDINENTDLEVEYTNIRKIRRVTTDIEFVIKEKYVTEVLRDLIEVEADDEKNKRFGYYYSDVREALEPYEKFSNEEIDAIFVMARSIVTKTFNFDYVMPDMVQVEIEVESLKFLNRLAMQLRAKKDIKNKYAYLIGVLDKKDKGETLDE